MISENVILQTRITGLVRPQDALLTHLGHKMTTRIEHARGIVRPTRASADCTKLPQMPLVEVNIDFEEPHSKIQRTARRSILQETVRVSQWNKGYSPVEEECQCADVVDV